MRIILGTLSDCIEETKKQIDRLEPARYDSSNTFENLVASIKTNIKIIEKGFEDISAAKEKANDFLVHQAIRQEIRILVC